MKNIIQRNKIVAYFGIGLAVLFIIAIFFGEQEGGLTRLAEIIIVDEKKDDSEPVETQQPQEQEELDNIPPPKPIVDEAEELEKKLTKSVQEKIDSLPPIVFTFTEEGFSPRSDEAVRGQRAIWVNNTDRQILIKELIKKHEEFSTGVVIEPKGLYEMTLRATQFWTFKEIESGKIGRILIYDQAKE
jgi:hypothetical protein